MEMSLKFFSAAAFNKRLNFTEYNTCCRLWGGFGRTTFEADKKAQLTALWPILFVASESFRANFKRALSD